MLLTFGKPYISLLMQGYNCGVHFRFSSDAQQQEV